MKKGFTKATVIMGLFFAAGLLTNCDTKKPAKKGAVIASNTVVNEKEIVKEVVYRKPVVFITGIDHGKQKFYKSARNYFLEKEFEVVESGAMTRRGVLGEGKTIFSEEGMCRVALAQTITFEISSFDFLFFSYFFPSLHLFLPFLIFVFTHINRQGNLVGGRGEGVRR